MAKQVGEVSIECVVGDITRQADMDAAVNAANAELMPGGGVAGAIHRAAGPELADECRPLAPIQPGQAVITSGQNMPNPYIIHCLGPVYGVDTPSPELLASCYREGLRVADENGLKGVAFPALSTGAFGYPMQEAARVALKTVAEVASKLEAVTTIRFVLTDERACGLHEEALDEALSHG